MFIFRKERRESPVNGAWRVVQLVGDFPDATVGGDELDTEPRELRSVGDLHGGTYRVKVTVYREYTGTLKNLQHPLTFRLHSS